MKWLAMTLVLANVALWYCSSVAVSPSRGTEQSEGRLPRVATLKAPPENAAEPAVPPQSMHCARLGWFESKADVREAAEALEVSGGEFRVEELEREQTPLHWVLIPPQPANQAREMFRDIQRRGIDSYLVTEGENRNAISLGLFESREAAISVLEEKKRQNLNAILAIFPRNQISYALVFEAGHFQNSEAAEVAEADYQKDFDLVEIRRCEGVATPEKTP
ncbi:hypothetical protein [Marinobacter sp. GN3S48]|uniref:hypothetical protein n=1 Tax=Marinobacter sp. GN3S48 TaxID=3382302 RepID=UPI00387AC3DA